MNFTLLILYTDDTFPTWFVNREARSITEAITLKQLTGYPGLVFYITNARDVFLFQPKSEFRFQFPPPPQPSFHFVDRISSVAIDLKSLFPYVNTGGREFHDTINELLKDLEQLKKLKTLTFILPSQIRRCPEPAETIPASLVVLRQKTAFHSNKIGSAQHNYKEGYQVRSALYKAMRDRANIALAEGRQSRARFIQSYLECWS